MATNFTQDATASGAAGPTDLQLNFDDIYTEIADYLGWSRSPSGERLTAARRYANDGYRIFLMGVDPRRGGVHDWGFLSPAATLAVTAGQTATTLPDDFRSMADDFAFDTDGPGRRLRQVSVVEIMTRRAGAGTWRGICSLYAIQPTAFSASDGQKYEALWWPTPAADVTLNYRYRANPAEMATATDRPMGGPAHAQTILQAGLMIAEARANDGQTAGVVGYHKGLFEQLMSHSIDLDRRHVPAGLGINADGSDDAVELPRRGTVTYT